MKRAGPDAVGGGDVRAKERRSDGADGARRAQPMTLRVPDPRHQRAPSTRVTLSQPREIAFFSKYANDRVEFDRSNLLKYRPPPIGADLLEGIESYTPKDESDPSIPPAPLAPLLAALDHFKAKLRHAPQFVTYRNNLNKILGTPYNTSSPWTMRVEKRDSSVYLDVRRTQDELSRNSRPLPQHQADAIYAGRRFELYATEAARSSDTSDSTNVRRVNQDEEYCGLFSLTLGDTRLVVAAEIDCYDSYDDRADSYEYVELKSTRVLRTDKDRYTFERFKLLSFWIQSFIVGTPRIVCGFRDDHFELQKLQTFKTTDIPSFCRKYWDPQVCLGFADTLLQWVYDTADEGQMYDVTYWPRDHRVEMSERNGEPSFLPVRKDEGSVV